MANLLAKKHQLELRKNQEYLNAHAAGENAECLSEVNEAREAAGLPKFKDAAGENMLVAPSAALQEGPWEDLCTYLIPVSCSQDLQSGDH